jgi:thiazole/oxazole-forming peptide maturase SagD family component
MSWLSGADGAADSVRLAPGHHLYAGADGVWRCALPGDRFLRLRAPSGVVQRAQQLLQRRAGAPGDDAATSVADQPVDTSGLGPFLESLAERGLLETAEPQASDLSGKVVFLEGDGPIARFVADQLEPHVKVLRGTADHAAVIGADLVISCGGWLPDAHWRQVDSWCVTEGVPWHRCYIEGTDAVVGPCWLPGRTASYADTRGRRLAAAKVPDELRELWSHLDSGPDLPAVPWPGPGGIAVVGGLLVSDALELLRGGPVPTEGQQIRVDPKRVVLHRHPVFPLPSPARQPGGAAMSSVASEPVPELPVSSLVDGRLGLLTRVVREPAQPALPRAFVDYTADVADTTEFAPWVADAIAGGAALDDPEHARNAAIGEAIERYCGNAVPDELPFGSFEQLTAAGDAPLDPAELALYSPHQYGLAGFPFVPLTRSLEVSWVSGSDLRTGAAVMVPASLTYLNVHRGGRRAEPPIAFQAFAGIAAGTTAAAAQRSALEELVERDAVTIWWSTGIEARRVDVAADPLLTGVLTDQEFAGMSVTFLAVPCSFDLPVIGVFLEDRRRGLVGFGSACRATPAAAAAKALTEAITTYTIGRELSEPDGDFWTSVRSGRLRQEPYRPFRPDRGYRAEFRPDWRDLTVLDLNLQLYLDPAMQGEPLRRLRDPEGGVVALDELPAVPGENPGATYVDRASAGLRPAHRPADVQLVQWLQGALRRGSRRGAGHGHPQGVQRQWPEGRGARCPVEGIRP